MAIWASGRWPSEFARTPTAVWPVRSLIRNSSQGLGINTNIVGGGDLPALATSVVGARDVAGLSKIWQL